MHGKRPRVLLAVTVYNGRAFVPRCLTSARNLHEGAADIDVLVLDDCSPEQGFSEMLEQLCRRENIFYYRTPRNLGIVRNVNLALLSAVENQYDYVIVSNSDVIYARSAVDELIAAASSGVGIGSVTAWSNNVSIYSIPNTDPDRFIATQQTVDWVGETLAQRNHGVAMDVPAGISFAILIPTAVVRDVGLMDPVFGRGYCEETDWSLRSLAKGYRITLAPAAFVYHQGRGSTVAAGLVSGGHTTVPANEAVIDHRYPNFRNDVAAFINGGALQRLKRDAVIHLLRAAQRDVGHQMIYSALGTATPNESKTVVCRALADGGSVLVSYRGFEHEVRGGVGETPLEAVRAFFGINVSSPAEITAPMRGTSQTLNYPVQI